MTYLDPIPAPAKTTSQTNQAKATVDDTNSAEEHTFVLSSREAKAASPDYMAVCGEEDPGEGLEFLVTDDSQSNETDARRHK